MEDKSINTDTRDFMTIFITNKARLKLKQYLIIIIIQTAFLFMLKPIISLFIFAATISLTQQLSAPLSLVQNSKYFVAGKYSASMLNETKEFEIPFSFALVSSQVAGVYINLFTIDQIRLSFNKNISFYSTALSTSQTSFKSKIVNSFL